MLKRQIDHKKECDIMTEVTYTNHISVEDYNALRDSVRMDSCHSKTCHDRTQELILYMCCRV